MCGAHLCVFVCVCSYTYAQASGYVPRRAPAPHNRSLAALDQRIISRLLVLHSAYAANVGVARLGGSHVVSEKMIIKLHDDVVLLNHP